jgi:hypothetical protein
VEEQEVLNSGQDLMPGPSLALVADGQWRSLLAPPQNRPVVTTPGAGRYLFSAWSTVRFVPALAGDTCTVKMRVTHPGGTGPVPGSESIAVELSDTIAGKEYVHRWSGSWIGNLPSALDMVIQYNAVTSGAVSLDVLSGDNANTGLSYVQLA